MQNGEGVGGAGKREERLSDIEEGIRRTSSAPPMRTPRFESFSTRRSALVTLLTSLFLLLVYRFELVGFEFEASLKKTMLVSVADKETPKLPRFSMLFAMRRAVSWSSSNLNTKNEIKICQNGSKVVVKGGRGG